MKKVIVLILIAAFAMPLTVFPVVAVAAAETAVTDVGNKLCPVTEKPVSGKDFVSYQGKRYGLCDAASEKVFLEDPSLYIFKVYAQEPGLANPEKPAETKSEGAKY